MTLWKLTKSTLCILVIALIFIGTLFMIGDAMLEGEAYATFFGYKLSDNYVYDSNNFLHIGNAIIIHDAPEYEYHHDTPVAYFDEEHNRVYVYRIIHQKTEEEYRVVDPYGTILMITPQNIIGVVIEN